MRRVYIKPPAPFASGDLHVGHLRCFAVADAYARFYRKQPEVEEVLFACAFDCYGLPSELAAEANDMHPREYTDGIVARQSMQLINQWKISLDWERCYKSSEVNWSSDIFEALRNSVYITKGTTMLAFCASCHTTLAKSQVENGRCWRCGTLTGRREVESWMLDTGGGPWPVNRQRKWGTPVPDGSGDTLDCMFDIQWLPFVPLIDPKYWTLPFNEIQQQDPESIKSLDQVIAVGGVDTEKFMDNQERLWRLMVGPVQPDFYTQRMMVEMVTNNGKISKSKGNIPDLEPWIREYGIDAVRVALLSYPLHRRIDWDELIRSHKIQHAYKSLQNFTREELEEGYLFLA